MSKVKTIVKPRPVHTEKIKLLKGVVMGPGDDGAPGDIYEVPKHIATELVSHGIAELTDEGDPLVHDERMPEERGVPYATATIEAPTSRDPKPEKRSRGRGSDAADE